MLYTMLSAKDIPQLIKFYKDILQMLHKLVFINLVSKLLFVYCQAKSFPISGTVELLVTI